MIGLILAVLIFAVPAPVFSFDERAENSGGAYLFVGRLIDGQKQSHVRRIAHYPRVDASADAAIEWRDLGRRIFWPLNADSALFISDPEFPAISASMKFFSDQEKDPSDSDCKKYSIEIAGEMHDELQNAARSIMISGKGIAFICDGEKLPRAAAMRIFRTIQPALWTAHSPDEEIKSEIDVAWAKAP